jgi:hypothetical protein
VDIYLAVAADALTRQPTIRSGHALAPSEDAYYARSTWNFVIPAWVGQMVALVRGRRIAQRRTPVAHHA